MRSIVRPVRRFGAAAVAACLLLPALATPASATPQTLLRGLSNLLLAPLDAALAPVSSAIGIYQNLQNIDDSRGVRIVYPIPAFFYATGLQIGCAWIRASSGLMEIVPGIPLAFMEADMNPLFDPAANAVALAEIELDFMDDPLRFGVNYTTPAF